MGKETRMPFGITPALSMAHKPLKIALLSGKEFK